MEEKSVKEILQSIRPAQLRVDADLRRLRLMRRQAEGAGAVDYSKPIICGGIPQTIGDSAVYLVAFEDQIKKDVHARNEIIRDALAIIEGVPDERYQLVLTLRYREFMRWKEIARRIGYTQRQTTRLHKRAIKAAEKIWNERKEQNGSE